MLYKKEGVYLRLWQGSLDNKLFNLKEGVEVWGVRQGPDVPVPHGNPLTVPAPQDPHQGGGACLSLTGEASVLGGLGVRQGRLVPIPPGNPPTVPAPQNPYQGRLRSATLPVPPGVHLGRHEAVPHGNPATVPLLRGASQGPLVHPAGDPLSLGPSAPSGGMAMGAEPSSSMPATSVSIPQGTGGGHATLAKNVGGPRVQHQLPQGVAQELVPTTPHLPNVAGGVPGQPQPTPTQWLGQPGASANGGGDPLALLVGGINQLQAAMLKQYDEGRSGDGSPEAVKPRNVDSA